MRRRFFSGDSLTQAINQAAQHFQAPADEIAYKTIDKRHGFLKVRRKVVISVDESNPFRNPERAEDTPAASAEASSSDTWSEVVRAPTGGEEPLGRELVEPQDVREPREAQEPRETQGSRQPQESLADDGETDEAAEPRATSWFDHEPTAEQPTAEEPAAEPERSFEPENAEPVSEPASDAPDFQPIAAAAPATDEPAGGERESTAGPENRERDEEPERPRRSRRGRGRGRRGDSRRVELAEAPPAAKTRFAEAQGEEAEAAAEALDRILKLAGLVVESEILQADEHLQIELRGADQDLLLRDRGRLLLAIQHLLPRAIRGLIGRSVVCKVDSDNYHEIREERLRDMAQRAADEVRDRGRPKTLEPMSPDERRIVHLTLADYPGVETESHGSGLFKRVMVRSASDSGSARSGGYRR